MRAPDDGSWHAFEIRTRKRYAAGWSVNAFRPFLKAGDLADAIKAARPQWSQQGELATLVGQFERPADLERHTLAAAPVYAQAVAPIVGALDYVPETRDYALIKQLLATTPFKSAEGAVWKEANGLETYAASTEAPFSIVPRGYEAGVLPVNEESCNRCHDQTGRMLVLAVRVRGRRARLLGRLSGQFLRLDRPDLRPGQGHLDADVERGGGPVFDENGRVDGEHTMTLAGRKLASWQSSPVDKDAPLRERLRLYDTDTGAWSPGPDLPFSTRRDYATMASDGSTLLVWGGWTDCTGTASCWKKDGVILDLRAP